MDITATATGKLPFVSRFLCQNAETQLRKTLKLMLLLLLLLFLLFHFCQICPVSTGLYAYLCDGKIFLYLYEIDSA